MQYAACADADVELFYPPLGKRPTEALKYCARCPVRRPCLEFGLTEIWGVYGGTTPTQRRWLRRQRREAA